MKALVRNWPWFALAIAVAVTAHLVSVRLLPHAVMGLVLAKVGPMDSVRHGKRPDETSRAVVRPSPDLLYSTCPYDLADGPLRVTAPVPAGTYWSVSAFDADTNNFFVENDRQAGAKVDFLLVQAADGHKLPKGVAVVVSPSRRGLVLFRTLIDDEARLPEIDRVRREAKCGTLPPQR
jgi:uncharacterized membrane protein